MHFRFAQVLAAIAIAGAMACGGAPEQKPAAPAAGALRVDAAKAGNITGRVVFEGTPPANGSARVGSDPVCMRENGGTHPLESYIVKDGGLENVFVYVKDGLGNYHFDVPADPVKLDQQGCRYM